MVESEIDFRDVPEGSALDEFHFEMWAGMLRFLIGKEEVLAAFKAETGKAFILSPRDAISAMVDQACGFDREAKNAEVMADFARWATDAYWGDEKMISPSISANLQANIAKEPQS